MKNRSEGNMSKNCRKSAQKQQHKLSVNVCEKGII